MSRAWLSSAHHVGSRRTHSGLAALRASEEAPWGAGIISTPAVAAPAGGEGKEKGGNALEFPHLSNIS